MKTIKILLVLLVFSAATFYSCSDSDPIENKTAATAQKSIALRTALNEIKQANAISGRHDKKQARTATNPFCFEFVYPVVFSYNNGTMITVTTFQGLVDLLANESPTFYMEGVVFPFQVTYGGAVHSITNEGELTALIQYCGFNTLANDLQNSYCFDIIFPITIAAGDQIIELHSIADLLQYLSPDNAYFIDVIFPFSVNYQGQVVVIHNLYELYQMIDNCDGCICTQEYAPVCIQTPTGIHEFGNMCYAICAGFTQNDIVSCNPSTECNISNLHAIVGTCNSNDNYQLTINFSYVNPSGPNFIIRDGNNTLIGTYPFSALPLTLNYPLTAASTGNLHVEIGSNCVGYASWSVPNCNASCESLCPTTFDPVCVQTNTGVVQYGNACLAECAGHTPNEFITCGVAPSNFGTQLGSCFSMVYPVQVEYQGALVTVNNDSELLQHWSPSNSSIPYFVYPVTVNFTDVPSPVSIESRLQFEGQISESCF